MTAQREFKTAQIEPKIIDPMAVQGEHNKWIALALCILLGYLGLHRFYEGKICTGILWLCTGGLCGIGVIVDAILIVLKPTRY